MWTAHKYISAPAGDGGKARIPNLLTQGPNRTHVCSMNQDKSKALAKTFFPEKPQQTDAAAIETEALSPICKMDPITRDQIHKHIARLKPFKAPGPDGIPNIVLSRCADLIITRLWAIYMAIVEKGLYYAPWKVSRTPVLVRDGPIQRHLLQGKQAQDASLWFPSGVGPDGPREIHAVTL